VARDEDRSDARAQSRLSGGVEAIETQRSTRNSQNSQSAKDALRVQRFLR
jgi:hypothetical protein